MTAISLEIEQVVEDVDARSDEAPGGEHEGGACDGFAAEVSVRGNEWHKNENVFAPLMATQRANECAQAIGARTEFAHRA